MKKFTRTINGKKYKGEAFEEKDILNKFDQTKEVWELIDKYQKKFPQLLINDTEDFVIDGETLCKELSVKDDFTSWLLADRKKVTGKLIKYRCKENEDYISDWGISDARFAKEEVQEMSSQRRSALGIKTIITLTLNCAKKIAMRQNNEQGDLVCDYFIMIEKILKDYEIWKIIREPEKQGNTKMKKFVKEWCIRNGYDDNDDYFYKRENNMLNICLFGLPAMEVRFKKGVTDNQTRDNLDVEDNSILAKLQDLNISLLIAGMSFEERKAIINNTCKTQYSYIKEKFNEE